jgi:hypothetical protein
MTDIGHTFGCVDPFAHSIKFHGTDINQVILQIKPDGTVLWKGREVESDADFRAAMMEVHQHMCGSANGKLATARAPLAEVERLRADLAQRTADFGNAIAERDVARWEIIEGLKEMHTTYGLRRELKRRGWWEWYKEGKP